MYQEGSKYEAISDYESDYEENWPESEYPDDGWLTAKDPIFWCLAPAHLEECVWLFRTAPSRQPTDSRGHPITLLEFYLRMEVTDLLNKLWGAPERIHDKLCIIWIHVRKRRNLSRENYLTHYFGPELDLLFDRDPDLPPSWEVTVPDHSSTSYENSYPTLRAYLLADPKDYWKIYNGPYCKDERCCAKRKTEENAGPSNKKNRL